MRRLRKSSILDAHGRSMSYFYDVARASENKGFPSWSSYGGDRDIDEVMPYWTWSRALNFSRWLFANFGLVSGTMGEMANYAFPIQPRYVGRDKAFKKSAEEWLWEWDKISDLRGGVFTRETQSRLRMTSRKVDGDIGVIFTRKPNGMPAVAHIRAHRIGSGMDPEGEPIKAGTYAGLYICNGVIHDITGRHIAYRVYTGKTIDKSKYVDISTRNMRLVYDPVYTDQYRGIGCMVPSITDFSEVKQLRSWEMYAQRKAAGMTFVEYNEFGEAQPGADFISLPDDDDTTTETGSGLVEEVYEQGLKQYFRANTGSKLEAVQFDRPSADSQAFEDKIVSQAIYGMGWDPNFALAIKEPGGAWARTIIDKVRRRIERDQAVEIAILRQIHIYAVSVAIKLGVLPEPSDGDRFSWEYRLPRRLTADTGNEEKIKLEKFKLGIQSRDSITGESGEWGYEVMDDREREVNDLFTRAKRLSKKWDIPIEKALFYLEQRTPNMEAGSSAPAQPTDDLTNDENQGSTTSE